MAFVINISNMGIVEIKETLNDGAFTIIPKVDGQPDYERYKAWRDQQDPIPDDNDRSPTLEAAKTVMIAKLYIQADNVVSSRYTATVMAGFAALYAAALNDGKTNRATYINELLSWGCGASVVYETKKSEINALTVVMDVLNFTWDTSLIEADDPEITIAGALAILD